MTSVQRLCRLCLQPENNNTFTRIFAKSSKTVFRIFILTGIKVSHIKNIPALICDNCLKILYEADQFRVRCLEADKYFQEFAKAIDEPETTTYLQDSFEENLKTDPDITAVCLFTSNQSQSTDFYIENHETPLKVKIKKDKSKSRYRPMCGYCGKEQESEYRLRQHELLSHTPLNQLSPDEVFVCDLCARIFKTKQSMRNHFIRAHTPKTEKFPCSICGKVLPHQKALYAHERVHIKMEATCQYCSKTFSRKVLLSSHIAIVHLKKRLSQCQYCPHQAITGGALKKHIRCKHLNLRQHHCDWPSCGKSFHENQHLVRHYRSHTLERPFECRNSDCGKAFSDHAKRTRHEKQNCPRRNN